MKHCNNHKQHPRTGKILPVALALLICLCTGTAQAQSVKIHQLGLGDGDCALIEIIDYKPNTLVPTLDTAVILIDAQRPKNYAAWEITDFIQKRLGPTGLNRKVIDYVVLSHVHIDHYGNMADVLEDLIKDKYEISYVFDRLAFNVSSIDWDLNDVEDCYSDIAEPGKMSASALEYHKFIQDNFAGYNFPIRPGSQLLENRFINARMTCVAAYGATLSPTTGKDTFFIPIKSGVYKPKSENDLSFAFLLSYGGFRYFTGGDLGGQDHGGYANGEVPVARYLIGKAGSNFHFCAFKVSHHGSTESSSPAFLAMVKPTLAIIPASLRHYGSSTKPLPTCATLGNLSKSVSTLVFTFLPKGNKSTLANFCKYRNLQQTQDVTLTVNFADLKDTIGMHLSFQPRNSDYDPVGSPILQDLKCTKVHAGGPFSVTPQVQPQLMMTSMDTVAANDADSFYSQGHPDLPPRLFQLPGRRMQAVQQEPAVPLKQVPAKPRKKKQKHNH
jgi:hypothetical protein